MGRVVAEVDIVNAVDTNYRFRCKALVDTGASGLILPKAWKERLGNLPSGRTVEMETADRRLVTGEVCGPVRIQIQGFDPIYNEVIFLDMNGSDEDYEPLLGYIILEQSRAMVDMAQHKLVAVKYFDLKKQ